MKRILYLDGLKCLAILLVVMGHCIQRSYVAMDPETDAFYYDSIFKFIYGCHMPLFITISGFFFYNSLQKYSFKDLIKSRFLKLIVPIIAWHIIWMITDGFSNQGEGYTMVSFVAGFLKQYWFLWAVFYCSIVVLFVEGLIKERIKLIIYSLLIVLSLFLPNILNIDRYVYLFPFYLIGFLYCKYCRDFECKNTRVIMGLGGGHFYICRIIDVVYIQRLHIYNWHVYNTRWKCLKKSAGY